MVPKGFIGLTLFPIIFLKHHALKKDSKLLNHERIHLRQQIELLVLPFYLIYAVEFLIRYIKLQDTKKAYRAISFEKEATKNEGNLEFLKKRPFWNFMQYF